MAETLIKLWMANGYLISKGNADMEAIGREYLENLAARCFFEDLVRSSFTNNILRFKMHDMVHDLAQYLTINEYSTMEVMDSKLPRTKFRHLTLVRSRDVSFQSIRGDTTKLHTLWVKCNGMYTISASDKFSPDFFEYLLHLKVLNISGNRFHELPNDIGKLLNLRYLNLSHNPLSKLPETVCELFKLQTLSLFACRLLEGLPQGIGKLENLRHLEMDQTDLLMKLPKGIRNLRFLRTLNKVVLSSINDDPGTFNLGDLKDLIKLRGKLMIEGLVYADVADAKKAELKKKHLVTLRMNFMPLSLSSQEVAEALELHPNVKFLAMPSYGGVQLPSWIVSLNNLCLLELTDCRNYSVLPPLGKLQSLEILVLHSMHGMKRIGEEFLGIEGYSNNGARNGNGVSAINIFPKLKSLDFYDMPSWEEWDLTSADIAKGVEEGNLKIMPCLLSLVFGRCIKLKELPEILLHNTDIPSLQFNKCPYLQQKYGRNSGVQWPESKWKVDSNSDFFMVQLRTSPMECAWTKIYNMV